MPANQSLISDDGLTIDEVYGDLQGLEDDLKGQAEQLNEWLASSDTDGQSAKTVRDYLESTGHTSSLLEVDLENATYDGAAGDFALELVIDKLDAEFGRVLRDACDAVGITEFPRLERATIGDVVVGRVRFSNRQITSVEQGRDLVEMLRKAGRERSVETLHHLAFDPGKISFKPGKISFKPSLVHTRGLGFKPGKISFKPAVILPQPAECNTDDLNKILQRRWRAAMGADSGQQDVTVAVLDTGINRHVLESHPLFAGQSVEDELGATPDLDLEPDGSTVDEYFGHGGLVAGIVAQMAPLARINHEAIRNVAGFSDSFEVARDLPDIADSRIVVFSFATSAASADDVPVLRRIVRHLMENDVLVVCANGSESDLAEDGHRLYPADFTRGDIFGSDDPGTGCLVSVDAVDRHGTLAPGTRRNADVSEPAVGVLSAFPHGHYRFGGAGPILPFCGWARVTGTSFAAPRFAGKIATQYIDSDGTMSPAAIARAESNNAAS